LHSSDAKIMAAAEEVSRITGEIDSSRTRLQRAEDNATELQSRLQAAEREAESAQAALEGAAEVDEVVDTSDRDALSAEVSQSPDDHVPARVSHKSASDRPRLLSAGFRPLLRAAKAAEAPRAPTQPAIARKKRAAHSARRSAESGGEAVA